MSDFVFKPAPPLAEPVHLPFPGLPSPLGPLASLAGKWAGSGFNVIWRPFHITPGMQPPPPQGQDRFLELNLTSETLDVEAISGPIPNRGLLQKDINMFGLTYRQEISDANTHDGLHIEPGIWATVPATTDPHVVPTVVRMASIPHGTTILAQGSAKNGTGAPTIPNNDITPFPIGGGTGIQFPERNLASGPPASNFRTPAASTAGITQGMVDNPNSVLQHAIANQTILSFTKLSISTLHTPILGGGTANTAFLEGGPHGPNAVSAQVEATFWIETVKGTPNFLQLQYTQTVLLNFNGLSWPHITVGTLRKHTPVVIPVQRLDPDIPHELTKPPHGDPGGPVEGAAQD